MNFKSGLKPLSEVHYNYAPEGLRKVEQKSFYHAFTMYCVKPRSNRQICRGDGEMPKNSSIILWELDYTGCEGMGVGVSWDYWADEVTYWVFGPAEKWKEFSGRFAAQFAGDNS